MKDIKLLGDQLVSLSAIEVKDLAQYLREAYGVEPATAPIPAGSVQVYDKANADLPIDLVMKSAGSNKLQVIKLVKELLGLGLKEAKDLVDLAPVVLKASIQKDTAEIIKNQLVNAGAEIVFK